MLESSIPKDIRKYDAKFVGPFTLRQLICAVIASVCCYVFYNVTKQILGSDIRIFLCFLIAAPSLVFGWVKPFGMPLEKFLQSALISNFLSPKQRKYKINNCYNLATDKFTIQSNKDYKKRKKKEKKLSKSDSNYTSYK